MGFFDYVIFRKVAATELKQIIFEDDIETKLYYTVAIDKPVIVFPYSRGNENSLDFDLGSINVSNKIKYYVETKDDDNNDELKQDTKKIMVEDISVVANEMQVIGSHNRSLRMVKVSLNVDVRRGIDSKIDLEPNMQINLQFDKFQITMTQQHYKDILNMLNGNIWANPSNLKINTSSIGDDDLFDIYQFKSKKAREIFEKYDKNSDKSELKLVINEINDLIKNIAKNTNSMNDNDEINNNKDKPSPLYLSKSVIITSDQMKFGSLHPSISQEHIDEAKFEDNNDGGDNKSVIDRHIIVDELMKLRILYQQYLFNYNVQQSELDRVLSNLNKLEQKQKNMDQGLPSYSPLASSLLQRKGSSVFQNDHQQQQLRSNHHLRSTPHLPPPTKPTPKTNKKKPRRRLTKQHKVRNEYDAILKHQSSIDESKQTTKGQKTSVHFTFDEVAEECMSMYVEVNMEQLKLSLCENRQLPFCQFSIDGFRTEWNRKHNGDHDTYLTINAIQLKKISGKGSKQQQYTQMLCPFDQIQLFVQNNPSDNSNDNANNPLSPISTSSVNLSRPESLSFDNNNGSKSLSPKIQKESRPEIIFTYDSSQKTSTKLEVNEPCGFLLPSVIKRLQEFFDVTSEPEVISMTSSLTNNENESNVDDETAQFIANWTSNTEFKLNGAKFICLENPNVVNTNAVVLNVSLGMRHGSVPIINEQQNKCVVHSDMEINIDSLNALICPANQIINTRQGGVRMHTIIEQQRLKCHISGDETISMLHKNQTIFKDMEINGEFDKLDFTISFIDIQIFQNIMNSIQNTFAPQNIQPLSERISSLIPIEGGLRDNYAKLRTQGHESELCFEALMKYKELQQAAQYCCDYSKSFQIRKNRGDIQKVIDLLPSNMYHNFRELSGRFDQEDIIRALIIGDNQLDKATAILNEQQTAINDDPYNNNNDDHDGNNRQQRPIKKKKTIIKNSYFSDYYTGDADDDDDADDEEDDYYYHRQNDYDQDEEEKKSYNTNNNNYNQKKKKYPTKLKINLTFESEKGIEINLINDVMSSSAMPFVGIKLYSMHLVWTQDIERTKGTFGFDFVGKYYNPMIVTMEPLIESSRIAVNWNSMPSSSKTIKPLYTIKVNLQGVAHERSALVPKIIPVNLNITHIFAKTLLETLHAWSHFAATRGNRIITSWKPFYIVNKTGELLSVWPSSEKDRQQEILPMEVQALSIRGGVRAAFGGRLLKYNRLEISFRVGNVASFEQISVFQNRRRKIMHKKHKVCVVLHTVFRKGSKFVYIWSPTEIRNHTARPLRIKLHFDRKALRVQTFHYFDRRSQQQQQNTESKEQQDGDPDINDDDINNDYNKREVIDFGVVEPGASVPVPLSIKSIESYISFKPCIDNGWNFTKLQKIRDLISSQKFTLIKSKWKSDYPSDSKPWQRIESFFLRPRYHRDLITIIIQSPLIITNLFPFPIRIQLKINTKNDKSFVWEQRIAAYESLPVTTDFEWQRRNEIKMGVWIPGFGQSEWIPLPTGDNIEPMPIDIFTGNDGGRGGAGSSVNSKLRVYLANRACKSVPFFRDDAPATLAMNMLYLYTKYLFINKTGLELEIRSPKKNLSMQQMEVEIEIFENQRKNVHGQWVEPFQPLDIPSECDRTHRPRNKKNIILPNKKWKWKSEWKVSEWEYARDFNYSFHKVFDPKNNDEVRRRKWSRIRIPHNKHNKMLSTISCFGGANSKINNKICLRVLDKNHRTDWSQYIPLNEAVTNMVLSIKSLANHKVFFDIAVIFELHRLYPQIKVIKFYPRFVGLNMCTFINKLHIRPYYIDKQQEDRNNDDQQTGVEGYNNNQSTKRHIFQKRHSHDYHKNIKNPNIYKYDNGTSSSSSSSGKHKLLRRQTTSSTRYSSSNDLHFNSSMNRHKLHLNRRSNAPNNSSQPALIDDSKRDERTLYTPDMPKVNDINQSKNITVSNEMLYSTPLHWFNILPTRYIQASINGFEWSCPFPIHEITQFPIRIKNPNDSNNGFSIIRVQSRTIGQTTIVVFRDERRDYPFFQIHNQTRYTIYYAQNIPNPTIQNKFYPISPSMAVPFAWNNLLVPKKKRRILLKIKDRQFEKHISLDSSGYLDMINVERKNYVYVTVQNRGATKVLTISENFQQEQDYENESNIDLNIRIDSFGISLIDELPMELLYINGDKLQFNLLLSRNEQRIRFSLDSFQIDNQMTNAISSVLFVGQSVKQSKTNKKLPWLQFQLDLFSQNVSSSKYVQTLNVRPQKFFLSLDGATLQRLINFFYVFSNMNIKQSSNSGDNNRTSNDKNEPQPMYFGQLFLAPMEFIVSFRDLDESFVSGTTNDDEQQQLQQQSSYNKTSYDEYASLNSSTQMHLAPLLNDGSNNNNNGNDNAGNVPLLNDIMYQFGVVVVNFDCAVLRVSGYAERDRVFDSTTLINRLSSHYSGELLRGFFNIIGSLEILGNIAGLTNSVRSGLQDFWYEPQSATTPGEVFKGFGKGTYSLLQQSIQGLTHSVSSLTSALGTGLAYASGDTDFAKQRSILKGKQNSKPKNMADGIFKGGKKLASSTWDGISGIWKDPIQGAQEDGYKGAIAGFGQGVMGLVCKPLVGVMDLGSDLVSGIGNTLPSVNNYNILTNVTNKRLPRMFYSKMNIMKEYKYSDALIKSNLNRMKLQYNNHKNNKLTFISFEGSFETEPNHQHELYIILGNGLLLCRWSQTKQNKLKFVNFYPWKLFFTISNRPGKKILICTFKSKQKNHQSSQSNIYDSYNDSYSNLIESQSNLNSSSSHLSLYDNQSYQPQRELRLPLKSAKWAELISRKLSQYVRASQRP